MKIEQREWRCCGCKARKSHVKGTGELLSATLVSSRSPSTSRSNIKESGAFRSLMNVIEDDGVLCIADWFGLPSESAVWNTLWCIWGIVDESIRAFGRFRTALLWNTGGRSREMNRPTMGKSVATAGNSRVD